MNNTEIEYVSYLEIIDKLDICEGDILYLPSQILGLARKSKKNGELFDANELINSIQRKLGSSGTLLIPTFNWEFSNEGHYDIKSSPSTTGALGNIVLQRNDFKRTQNPLHSFAVWGRFQEELCKQRNYHSYGEDSPFAFMLNNRAKCLIFGTDYCHAYTFIHYVEYCEKVPFRYDKVFNGMYCDENGDSCQREYALYVRDLNKIVIENFNEIGNIMEQSGVSTRKYINGEPYIIIDVAKSYDVIANDINNNCKNLYILE